MLYRIEGFVRHYTIKDIIDTYKTTFLSPTIYSDNINAMSSLIDINNNEIRIEDLLNSFDEFSKVENHFFENVFEISFHEAFDISAIIGCSYLLTKEGVSMKGRNELFIHRSVFQNNCFIYTPGLFSRDIDGFVTEGNSRDYILKKYPEIFKNRKYLVLIEMKINEMSNIEERLYQEIINNGEDPTNYLVLKVRKDSGLEPFLEYLSYRYFKKYGFIFENQAPFFQQNYKYKNKIHNGGIPDISIFKSSLLQNFNAVGFSDEKNGFIINSIPFFRELMQPNRTIKKHNQNISYEISFGEAKISKKSSSDAVKQLNKYSAVDLGTDMFSFIPDLDLSKDFKISSMYLDEYKIKYSKNFSSTLSVDIVNEDEKFTNLVIKLNALGSLSFELLNDEICNLFQIKQQKGFKSFHLVEYALNVDLNHIIELGNN